MAFERLPPDNSQGATATELILKRNVIIHDQSGRVMKGEYPNTYFIDTPGYFNKDATLANKNKDDLHYDFQHFMLQGRFIRENTPEEDFTIGHIIKEYDREYSAMNLDTMNKEGANNNRRLINTNITESTTKTIDGSMIKPGGGLFSPLLNVFKRR